uniref:Uncharacterized protein n=1 Tax=Angiostrongylus cantonensis TaxID=6313 RepID=A0A0K0D994_ANGCA
MSTKGRRGGNSDEGQASEASFVKVKGRRLTFDPAPIINKRLVEDDRHHLNVENNLHEDHEIFYPANVLTSSSSPESIIRVDRLLDVAASSSYLDRPFSMEHLTNEAYSPCDALLYRAVTVDMTIR